MRRTARFSQIAIIAARQAVAQAGLALQSSPDGTPDGVDRDRVGVVNGTSLGSFTDTYQQVESGGPTHERISPFFVAKMLPNMAGASLAMEFGFPGHNDTSVTPCAPSPLSIGNALRVLQSGDADAVLARGTEPHLSDEGLSPLSAIKAQYTP